MLYSERLCIHIKIAKEIQELILESEKRDDLKELSFEEAAEIIKIDTLKQIFELLDHHF